MNTKMKKMIILILVVIVAVNSIFPSLIVSASTSSSDDFSNGVKDPLSDNFSFGILDGALGILLYPWKLAMIVPAAITRVAINSIAGDNATIQTIFFNKINLLNINIFEAGDGTVNAKIAEFYVGLRNLSITISLAMLIYIGIRMATNSIGEDKAKYKEMLKNWVVGFALIFIMQYIIFFVIKANELLIKSLELPGESQDVLKTLAGQIWAIPFTTSFASIIMYIGLVLMTFVFLLTYIKRVITVSFLIVISPLISVTYAVDKVGNNKSEILNMWIREFLYNVLIQPFHCIIFSIFVYTAMDLITRETNFGSMAFAIILTFFIFTGQKLIREIFGFNQSKSFYEKALNFAIVTKIYSDVKNTINDVKSVKGAKNDLAARRQQKMLNNIEDSDDMTGDNLVKFRMMAEENRFDESEKTNTQSSTSSNSSSNNHTRTKIDINRPMKHARRRVKRAARLYKNTMKKYTGYNAVNRVIKNRRSAKIRSTKLNNQDYVIALSEMYRQSADPSLSNLDLANAYDRINGADIEDLTAEELSYKVRMAALKSQLKISDDEIKDAIINGSNQNRRWRG